MTILKVKLSFFNENVTRGPSVGSFIHSLNFAYTKNQG